MGFSRGVREIALALVVTAAPAAAQTGFSFPGLHFYPDDQGRGAVVGHFDADGLPDVVRMTRLGIDAWRGAGSGWFELVRPLSVGAPTSAYLVAGDFDGNGRDDVATVEATQLTVYLGFGDFLFWRLPAAPHGTRGVLRTGDLNGDGVDDLAGGDDDVFVLIGNGDGTFQPVATYPVGGAANPLLADLRGDGTPDVVVTVPGPQIGVLVGNPDGTLQPVRRFPYLYCWGWLGAADLDGDRLVDVAIPCGSGVLVMRGDGTGALGNNFQVPLGLSSIRSMGTSDVDGDGVTDIVAFGFGLNPWVYELCTAKGRGNGTFDPPSCQGSNMGSSAIGDQGVQAVDIDGDGVRDVFMDFYENFTVALGRAGQPLLAPDVYDLGASGIAPHALAGGDFDADGRPDLAAADELGQTVTTLLGDGSGGFAIATPTATASAIAVMAVADFDRDGRQDLAVARNEVQLLKGNGDGTFDASERPVSLGTTAFGIAAGDLDGDATPDVVAGGSILLVRPGGALGPPTRLAIDGDPRGVAMTDIDGDGGRDVLVVDGTTNVLQLLLGNGDGTFRPAVRYGVGATPVNLLATDLDGDARPDVVTVNRTAAGSVTVLRNVGGGALQSLGETPAGFYPEAVAAGDLDGDGRVDLAVSVNLSAPYVRAVATKALTLLAGDGTCRFRLLGSLQAGAPLGVVAEDFDGNGVDDLAVASNLSNAESVMVFLAGDGGGGEILAGRGLGAPNPSTVRTFTGAGVATPVGFDAYGGTGWGVNLFAAGLDAEGRDEIVTGPGPGSGYGPHVRGFRYTGTPLPKVSFYAYGTLRYGVNVAGGDLEADGFDEILTGAGPASVFGPHVRGFDLDGASATPMTGVNYFAYGTLRYGVNVGAGDLERDGFAEILTGPGPGGAFSANVRGFDHDGAGITPIGRVDFLAFSTFHGVAVADGDADADGFDEIACTPGPGAANPSRFLGFDDDGAGVRPLPGYDVTPYATLYGARAGMASLGPAGWSLLCGAGRDPAASSDVTGYDYTGSGLSLRSGTPFTPFAPGYGVNVSGGRLGF